MIKEKAMPNISVLTQAARDIVLEHKKKNGLDSLSVNGVKRQLENDFSLEEKSLNVDFYKKAIGSAIKDAVLDDTHCKPVQFGTNQANQQPKFGEIKRPEIEKEQVQTAALSRTKSLEKEKEYIPYSMLVSGPQPPKKKEYKMPNPQNRGRRDFTLKTSLTAKKTNTAKSGSQTAVRSKYQSQEYIEDDEVDSAITEGSADDGESSEEESSTSGLESESEELQQRRNRRKRHERGKESSRKRFKAAPEIENSNRDEAMIEQYKRLVSACGVRKKWSTELENYPKPERVRRLRQILTELGMKGRYTMEKAKRIKKKRDFAKELEDVIEYERKAGMSRECRKQRGSKSSHPIGELDTETETESEFQRDASNSEEKPSQSASMAIKEYMNKQKEKPRNA